MRTPAGIFAGLLVALAVVPLARPALADGAAMQAFLGGTALEGDAAAANAPDAGLYADGTLAINQGKWAEAEAIFAKVAAQQGAHADGALYWKAYAENKLGQAKPALATCTELRSGYPKSRWLDECGALEIEIRAQSGQAVKPEAGESDEMKLLALNTMLRQDEPRALAEIQEILKGDGSERLKQEAQFILGQHYSDATYPQIARISYVEGDVRVARGREHETGAVWEKAEADLPLETGYSLVTGAGRAEIELENASTFYVGENSVISFNELQTTAGIPYTDVALLSGTVTLHVKPYVAGEQFVLRTPTDELATEYPFTSAMRVTSYTDGIAITQMEDGALRMASSGRQTATPRGQTQFYHGGAPMDHAEAPDGVDYAAWDKWVAEHYSERTTAMAAVMKASGLTKPIPGMAALAGQGTFFPCAPYGTCWEPGEADGADEAADAEGLVSGQPGLQAQPAGKRTPAAKPGGGIAAAGAAPRMDDDFFPCVPLIDRYRAAALTPGIGPVTNAALGTQRYPYNWAVCHTGSWIRHRHRYVWVAGHKRHHLPPYRWVKSGHRIAFVPLHPYDVKGRPPINVKEEIFALSDKKGLNFERIRFDVNKPIELMKDPPKQFRDPLPLLVKAEEPRIEAHSLRHEPGETAHGAIPVRFDHKSGVFTMPHTELHGGKTTTVFAPIGNRGGTLQAHGGGFGGSGFGGGGFHGSGGGSVAHGGSSGGGGSHSSGGGGGGGGGGASHSGGGGASSGSSGGGSGSGSGSGASSGGGSHK